MRALDGTCQHPDHHALRGPFRPDEEDVLAGEDGEDQALDLLGPFEETAFHLRLEGLEPCGLDHSRERLSARGAQIPFDVLPRVRRRQDRDSHLRVGGEERNEFCLAAFTIQTVQDFEVTRPVMVSEENQPKEEVAFDLELPALSRVLDHKVGVSGGPVAHQAALDRHEETRFPTDCLRNLALVREMEVNRIPIDKGAGHGPGPETVCTKVYLSPNSSNGAVGVLPRRMSSGSCGFPFSHTRSMDRSGAHRLWEMSAGIAVQSPGFM